MARALRTWFLSLTRDLAIVQLGCDFGSASPSQRPPIIINIYLCSVPTTSLALGNGFPTSYLAPGPVVIPPAEGVWGDRKIAFTFCALRVAQLHFIAKAWVP